MAELGDGHLLLLLEDKTVLLLSVFRFQALPGQGTFQEIDEDISDALQVVSAALLNAQVVIDAGIARRARQVPSVPMRNVLQILGVAISF